MKKLKLFYTVAVYLSLVLLIITTLITFLDNTSLNYFILIKSAEIGTYLLFLTLLAKSLYFILKHKGKTQNKLYTFLRSNNLYQREQGLIVFNIIFIHIVITTIMMISNISSLIFYYVSGIIPTIIFIYMEITSFNFFQVRIKNWKKHHSIIWLTIPLIYIHVLLISTHTLRYLVFGGMVVLIALFEKIFGLRRGTQHLVYVFIGILLSTSQFFGTQLYNTNKVNSQSSQTYSSNEESVNSNTSNNENIDNNIEASDESDTTDKSVESDNIPPENFSHHGHGGERGVENTESTSTTSTYTSSTQNTDGTYTYNDGTYTGEGNGHVGSIVVETTIENDKIISIEVIDENEDEPWWEPVISTLPDQIIANNSTDGIEYIAGSTHSSKGFLEAVDDSLANSQA